MKICCLTLLLCLFFRFSEGQDLIRCQTPAYEAFLEKKYPGYLQKKQAYIQQINQLIAKSQASRIAASGADSLTEPIYRIPVVVHVIHNNANGTIGGQGNSNITDAQILSQIQVLNEDYRKQPGTPGYNNDPRGADTRIEFCLASRDPSGNPTTGIVRTYNSKSKWSITDNTALKATSYWPSDQYLNIWVTDLSSGEGNNQMVIGYAQFPASTTIQGLEPPYNAETDGVVIDYEFFGNTGVVKYPYNLGRTATHEIGHWLGLLHIWGDAVTQSPYPCSTDYVPDTPPDRAPNYSISCKDSSNCSKPTVYTQDLTNDYLDYSPDVCMNIFTQGQKQRMRKILETNARRIAVLNSPGCCGGIALAQIPLVQDFENPGLGNWELINPAQIGILRTSPGSFSASSNSFRIPPAGVFTGDTSSNKNYAFLLSPEINYSSSSSPELSFDLAYAAPSAGSSTDSLVLSYQTNCGLWYTLTTLYGNSLITTTRTSPDFIPMADEWKTLTFPLSQFAYKVAGRIRFEFYSKSKNNIYLDNINLYETQSNLSVQAYPNPATSTSTIRVLFDGRSDIQLQLFNMLGQEVFDIEFKNTTSFSYPVDFSGLSDGMYIVRALNGKKSSAFRIFVGR